MNKILLLAFALLYQIGYAQIQISGTVIDGQTKEDGTVTIRERDTMEQIRVLAKNALLTIQEKLNNY